METDNALLRERIAVSESLAILRVAPMEGRVPEFEPGQFTVLGVRLRDAAAGAALSKRPFSIASSSRTRDHLEFYVRRIAEGELSPSLFALERGGSLWLDPRVYGSFTLAEVPRESRVLMVATGTGLAPFVSMLRTYQGAARWRRCVLLESARTSEELGYRAELERIEREDPTFAYRPTLTREPAASAWRGLRGRVQEWLGPEAFRSLSGDPLDPSLWQVLLCGNPQMIDSVTELLAPRGFERHHRRKPGQVHSERYW